MSVAPQKGLMSSKTKKKLGQAWEYNPRCSLTLACNKVDSGPGLGVQHNPTQLLCNSKSNGAGNVVQGVVEQYDSSETCKSERNQCDSKPAVMNRNDEHSPSSMNTRQNFTAQHFLTHLVAMITSHLIETEIQSSPWQRDIFYYCMV